MESLVTWVKGIVCYSILTAVFSELLPSKYYKYIKLYMGLLFILLFLSPAVKLFHLESLMEDFFHKENLKIELADKSFELELKQQEAYEELLKEYHQQLTNELSAFLEERGYRLISTELVWNEDTESKAFGEVAALKLTVGHEKSKDTDIYVDRIQVEVFQRQKENGEEKALKNELANFYNIDASNINVSIQGGGDR